MVRPPRESFPQDLCHPESRHLCPGCSVSGFWSCNLVVPCFLFLPGSVQGELAAPQKAGARTSDLRKDSLRWGRG